MQYTRILAALLLVLWSFVSLPVVATAQNPNPSRFYELPMPITIKYGWGFWNVTQLVINEATRKTPAGLEAVEVGRLVQEANPRVPLMISKDTGELNWIERESVLIEYMPKGYVFSPALLSKIAGNPPAQPLVIAPPTPATRVQPTTTSTTLVPTISAISKGYSLPFNWWDPILLALALALGYILFREISHRRAAGADATHPDHYRGRRSGLFARFFGPSPREEVETVNRIHTEADTRRAAAGQPRRDGRLSVVVRATVRILQTVMVNMETAGENVQAQLLDRTEVVIGFFRNAEGRIVEVVIARRYCLNGLFFEQLGEQVSQVLALIRWDNLIQEHPENGRRAPENWEAELLPALLAHFQAEARILTTPTPQPVPVPIPADENREILGFILAALGNGEVTMNADHFARLARVAAEAGFRFTVAQAGDGQVTLRGVANDAEENTNVRSMNRPAEPRS